VFAYLRVEKSTIVTCLIKLLQPYTRRIVLDRIFVLAEIAVGFPSVEIEDGVFGRVLYRFAEPGDFIFDLLLSVDIVLYRLLDCSQ